MDVSKINPGTGFARFFLETLSLLYMPEEDLVPVGADNFPFFFPRRKTRRLRSWGSWAKKIDRNRRGGREKKVERDDDNLPETHNVISISMRGFEGLIYESDVSRMCVEGNAHLGSRRIDLSWRRRRKYD
ncbi:hypothetical protein RUM44_006605 [Polyplax serrata]|uniref:Uncharacterized protein n=1 Tax=Polyplax serrata TaxID=468196 RepID=A0ABR1AII2_POLSC